MFDRRPYESPDSYCVRKCEEEYGKNWYYEHNRKDPRDYTSKERLFKNLNILKTDIKELKIKLQKIEDRIDSAFLWESLITDVDQNK